MRMNLLHKCFFTDLFIILCLSLYSPFRSYHFQFYVSLPPSRSYLFQTQVLLTNETLTVANTFFFDQQLTVTGHTVCNYIAINFTSLLAGGRPLYTDQQACFRYSPATDQSTTLLQSPMLLSGAAGGLLAIVAVAIILVVYRRRRAQQASSKKAQEMEEQDVESAADGQPPSTRPRRARKGDDIYATAKLEDDEEATYEDIKYGRKVKKGKKNAEGIYVRGYHDDDDCDYCSDDDNDDG
jgi:hypothetical protein